MIKKIKAEFLKRFDAEPAVIKSPGRVNLIGEHTDYNQGFVLPAAIDKSIILAMATNNNKQARFYAMDKKESYTAGISEEIQRSGRGWPDYLLGVVDQLHKHGYDTGGFDCVFGGDVPVGAGMSSSAALEGGVLYGLSALFDLDIPLLEMARIAQQAENEFVGVQCGIMDQFASLHGKNNHALKLDCRSLEFEYVSFNQTDVSIVLCDTGVRRELASSEYNVRRSQCEQGIAALQQKEPSIQSLRDVRRNYLLAHKQELEPVVFQRCKFVVEENRRVLQACDDLANNDLQAFGQRMYESHAGLRDEYEVSCRELDVLVGLAREISGVYGARMMGGGFGGCTINLVEARHMEAFVSAMKTGYAEKMNTDIDIYKMNVSEGTHQVTEKEAESGH